MKNKIVKALALGGMLLLCLSLSGCYIPPDDLSGEVSNIGVGSNNLPFDPVVYTEAPTASPTPTAAPVGAFGTSQPVETTGGVPNVNWNQGVGDPITGTTQGNQPGAGVTIGVTPATTRPSIGVTTGNPSTTRPSSTSTPAPSSLKKGSSGDSVKALQKRLKELGYYTGSVDGDFGENTEKAVKAFQERNGLTVDGKAGTNTMAKLNSSSAVKAATATATPKKSATATPKPKRTATPTPRKTATPTPKPTSTPNLTKEIYLRDGSSGKDVKRLQERLISLGWLTGTANSDFGGAVEAAVMAFQKKTSGLYDDGVAGPETLKALYSNNAAKSSSPVASVGVKLQSGSEGDAVRALQKRLKTLGYLKETPDGSYGEKTKAAVIAFQTNNGLKVDGIAGTNTLDAIYSQNALKAGQSVSSGTGTSGSNANDDTYSILREGDSGQAVRQLQQALKNLGYYSGTVDGKYGSGTVDAVKLFQQMNGLRVDGKAGEATQRALYGTSAKVNDTTLRVGSEGSDVSNLQHALYELGYYDGQINGIYSNLVSEAVKAFQSNNGLKADGVAGKETLQKLYSSSAKAAGAASGTFEKLQKGDSGSAVVEMQDVLKGLGYLAEITGIYDDATYWAVKSFQERNGLTSDGIAGNETLTKLYSGSAVSMY